MLLKILRLGVGEPAKSPSIARRLEERLLARRAGGVRPHNKVLFCVPLRRAARALVQIHLGRVAEQAARRQMSAARSLLKNSTRRGYSGGSMPSGPEHGLAHVRGGHHEATSARASEPAAPYRASDRRDELVERDVMIAAEDEHLAHGFRPRAAQLDPPTDRRCTSCDRA